MDHPFENLVHFPADIVIPSDINEAQRVQELIIETLTASRFGERDVFAIRLALEEALVNALKHGNQLDPKKNVRIAFCVEGDDFYIRISDEGRGFNPEDVPDPTDLENLERPCGRGLMLMRHYMNEVQYVNNGNTVFMWKRRNGSPD